MITYNRAEEAQAAAERIRRLPERPSLIVVDNGSTDGTAAQLRGRPGVQLVALGENRGAAARNVGVRAAQTEYVAFCDDDCWWEPGSLAAAVALLDHAPRLAVATARVLVEPGGRLDSTCAAMAASPLPREPDVPGTPILGFMAGASVVRRAAFLSVGGFEPRFFLGGEEELMAIDLVAVGWRLAYVPQLTVRHAPSPARDPARRARVMLRNALWSAWLRRPARDAMRRSLRLLATAPRNRSTLAASWDALAAAGWVARNRRVVGPEVAAMLRRLDPARPA